MHLGLEQEVATLHRKPAALVFSSCYVANDATLSTLGAKLPGCVFFSDTMNHASMIQGMRHSGAKRVIFKHNDLEDLETKLKMYPKETPKVIAFESVYSMCGSIGPVKEICDLAEKYGALTFLDEVCILANFKCIQWLMYCFPNRSMPLAYMDPTVLGSRSTSIMRHTMLQDKARSLSKALSWTVLI
jgi:cystathionine beta-lyase/cystathionine gamma-synthase